MLGPINDLAHADVKRRIIALKASLLTRCGLGLPFIMFDDARKEYYKALKDDQRAYVPAKEAFADEYANNITDAESVRRAQLSVAIALMEMRELGVPIVAYEPKSGKIYKEYADGKREEVGKRA